MMSVSALEVAIVDVAGVRFVWLGIAMRLGSDLVTFRDSEAEDSSRIYIVGLPLAWVGIVQWEG